MKDVSDYYVKYLRYVVNTGISPLPIDSFDDDWAPVGAVVREEMVRTGLIAETQDGITLTDAGKAALRDSDAQEAATRG